MIIKKRKPHQLYNWRKRFSDAWLLFKSNVPYVGDPPLEDADQYVFVRWFDEEITKIYGVYLHSNANEGRCSWEEGQRLKAMGKCAGIPDTSIPELLLYIEFKRINGKVTAEQSWWHTYLRKCGFTVLVVYGIHDAMKQFDEFMKVKKCLKYSDL